MADISLTITAQTEQRVAKFYKCIDCGNPKINFKQQRAPRCHSCENKRRYTNIVYYACPVCGYPKVGRGRSDRILCNKCAAKVRWKSAEHRKKIHDAFLKRANGKVKYKYVNFTDEIKELVRERDDRKCFICGVPEDGKKHDVHHIDYDKGNSTPENLITLCRPCHSRTCYNREYWKKLFNETIS